MFQDTLVLAVYFSCILGRDWFLRLLCLLWYPKPEEVFFVTVLLHNLTTLIFTKPSAWNLGKGYSQLKEKIDPTKSKPKPTKYLTLKLLQNPRPQISAKAMPNSKKKLTLQNLSLNPQEPSHWNFHKTLSLKYSQWLCPIQINQFIHAAKKWNRSPNIYEKNC